jgi:hypothetical protein
MSVDIDWVMALIKTPIIRYLSKYESLALSLVNKCVRIKLYPTLFNELTINSKVLFSRSNYFEHEKFFKFNNLTYIEKLQVIKKIRN